MASSESSTLYRRLGGYDVIAGVVDDFLDRFRKDPRFARFGTGRSLDSIQRARQLIVDQMCALAGGPCIYTGRDMKTSHTGLGITETEWQANMEYAAASLDKFGIGAREKEEFLDIFRRYKNDIVEKP
jgi:hemoglobin